MTTPITTSPNGFKPAFARVQQSNDFDDLLACVATLTGKTLAEVRQAAVKHCKIPANGPYYLDETLLTKLFESFGLTSSPYREITFPIAQLAPDVALLLIEYDPNTEVGRHVVFHRMRTGSGFKDVTEYVIDPAYWIPPAQQIRTDLKSLQAAWWVGVHPLKPANGK